MQAVASLAVAAAWLLGPGVLLLVAGRARVGVIAAAAVPVGALALGWSGILLHLLHVRFDPASVTVTLLVTATGVGVVRHLRRSGPVGPDGPSRRPAHDPFRMLVLAGCAVAALITTVMWAATPGWLSRPSQYVDSFWHAYLIGLVRFRGLADPWGLTPLNPLSNSPRVYYPTGLHLVAGLASWGTDGARALASVQFLAAAVVAPVGTAVLARTIFGRRPLPVAAAPVLVSLAGVWQVWIGTIPAYQLGVAVAPGLLALLLRARVSRPAAALAGICLAGLWLIQPAAALLFLIPWLVFWCWPASVDPQGEYVRRLQASACIGVVAALAALPWFVTSIGLGAGLPSLVRPPGLRVTTAGANAVLLTLNRLAAPWVTVVLAAVGVVLGVRGRLPRWLVLAWLGACGLFVLTASISIGARRLLVSPWVGDWWRISPLVALLAALLGAAALDWLSARLPSRSWRTGGSVLAAGLVALTAWHVAPSQRVVTAGLRAPKVVTDSEVAGFRWLQGRVGPSQLVLNCWSDGSSWMYGLFGVPVADPYLVSNAQDPDLRYVMGHLTELGTNARLDRLVRDRGLRFVMVNTIFLTRYTHHYCYRVPAGNPLIALVHESGGTKVYEIDLAGIPS